MVCLTPFGRRHDSALGAGAAMASVERTALGGTRMLILTSLRDGTGNAVTAARLAERIPAAHCSLLDINALPDAEALREHVCKCQIGLVLGIHAYRAGRLLVGSGVPFAIVLGGTDMNVMLHDEPKRRVMLDAIAQVMLCAPCCTRVLQIDWLRATTGPARHRRPRARHRRAGCCAFPLPSNALKSAAV